MDRHTTARVARLEANVAQLGTAVALLLESTDLLDAGDADRLRVLLDTEAAK